MDNSNYYDLDPSPCMVILRIILFSHKKVEVLTNILLSTYSLYDNMNKNKYSKQLGLSLIHWRLSLGTFRDRPPL